jgi:hypothetical protein
VDSNPASDGKIVTTAGPREFAFAMIASRTPVKSETRAQ